MRVPPDNGIHPNASQPGGGSDAFVRFNLAGDKFFVLGGAPSAYAFDLNKPGGRGTTQAK